MIGMLSTGEKITAVLVTVLAIGLAFGAFTWLKRR